MCFTRQPKRWCWQPWCFPDNYGYKVQVLGSRSRSSGCNSCHFAQGSQRSAVEISSLSGGSATKMKPSRPHGGLNLPPPDHKVSCFIMTLFHVSCRSEGGSRQVIKGSQCFFRRAAPQPPQPVWRSNFARGTHVDSFRITSLKRLNRSPVPRDGAFQGLGISISGTC